jgi:hypothetical protein
MDFETSKASMPVQICTGTMGTILLFVWYHDVCILQSIEMMRPTPQLSFSKIMTEHNNRKKQKRSITAKTDSVLSSFADLEKDIESVTDLGVLTTTRGKNEHALEYTQEEVQ